MFKTESSDITVPFRRTLLKNSLDLVRGKTTILQINMGLLCNQYCRHCHLSAGPDRKESMSIHTVKEVVSYAERCRFEVIDITGGAPELNENLGKLIETITPLAPRVMLRSNLTVLNSGKAKQLMELLRSCGVVIVASFPSLNETQTDSQRGQKVYEKSIVSLKRLNDFGYGMAGSGLELNIVSNPAGAFLPQSQEKTEKRFHQIMKKKWRISFNNLYSFANIPLGRFREWLSSSGNLEDYLARLTSSFNPCAVDSLMCRTLVSVSWDGYLYDCDFNLAKGRYMGGREVHISEMSGPPKPGSPIAMDDHCYACTAGAGFS
ncbi:MAG: radical SAM/Cys-rich domain protein [Desulfobacterales bacterium]|nr:radical SAM/Cys-rich domain protein [Desulfobacterales bacterium]